jgi:polyferredoxin
MKSANKSLIWLLILVYSGIYWILAYYFVRDTGPVFKGYMGVFGIFYILSLICFEVVTNRKKYAAKAKSDSDSEPPSRH